MKSKILKLSLLTFGFATAIYILWVVGLDWGYSYALTAGVNLFLAPAKGISAELAAMPDGAAEFRLIVDGRAGHFQIEAVILPFVLLLAWQIALVFVAATRPALKTGGINIASFYLLQVLFLLTFVNQGTSAILNVLKESLIHSFGIFAVFFIIKDIVWFRLHTDK